MGEVFAGRYELVDPVGRGGAGAVWRAWDHRRKRYVAAKVLRQSDAHTLLRFVREQALRIDHPHVLAPTSWAADDDKVLFTMDLLNGGSLAHLISDYGPLPPAFVCILLDQLLAGLGAVHAEDVVHRDIKPANILLEATGAGRPHLRLSDFGIAMRKGEPRLTETDYVVGTPGYFAPEQMLGAEPDVTADLYAVGLVALYLLDGRKPDPRSLMESYREGTPCAPGSVPEPLWQVLGTLLHPDPYARFRTATGVRKALAGAVELLTEDSTLPLTADTVEVFDHIGPLPPGYGPRGPHPADEPQTPHGADGTGGGPAAAAAAGTGSFHLAPPAPAAGSETAGAGTAGAKAPGGPHADEASPAQAGAAAQAGGGAQAEGAARSGGGAQAGTPPTPTPLLGGAGLPYTGYPPPGHPAAHSGSTPPAGPGGATPPGYGCPGAYGYPGSPGYADPARHGLTAPADGHPAPATASGAANGAPGGAADGRRPGPSRRAAVAVVLLALACFAVGLWGLTGS